MVEKSTDKSGKSAEEKKVELVSTTEKVDADGKEQSTEQFVDYAGSSRERHVKADPTKSNIPINPDKEDVQELLEVNIKKLNVPPVYAKRLRLALAESQDAFDTEFDDVCSEMMSKKDTGIRDTACALKDLKPLFYPHTFWDSQPVPKPGQESSLPEDAFDKCILEQKIEDIRKEPYALPEGFHWADLDLTNEKEAGELYRLLTANYVEDDDACFRFDYKVPFLRWALNPPEYYKNWMVGVRGGKKNALFGFIGGIPVKVKVNGKEVTMCEINFLCVHKKLRAKKLAPVLIKEITRRVNCEQIWQAIYTAGITIPTPFSGATYYHRSINLKKLVETRFTSLKPGVPMSRSIRIHKLPATTCLEGIREMGEKDIDQVRDLLNANLDKTSKVHFVFNSAEIKHFMLPQEDVVYSYVVEDKAGKITDFFSFYSLPSSVLKENPGDHKTLNVAYSFYNVTTTDRMKEGISDMLVLAEQNGYDVMNCLDLCLNDPKILTDLQFGVGDGKLHYYFYNWRVHSMEASDLGIVLV